MIVRAIDTEGDWTFGKGRNDYLRDLFATTQDINCRLKEFLGDCFFDIESGIDWFNLLGSKNIVGLNLAIKRVILNTQNVSGVVELSLNVFADRKGILTYEVATSYLGNIRGSFGLLTTQDGLILTTEDGDPIST